MCNQSRPCIQWLCKRRLVVVGVFHVAETVAAESRVEEVSSLAVVVGRHLGAYHFRSLEDSLRVNKFKETNGE